MRKGSCKATPDGSHYLNHVAVSQHIVFCPGSIPASQPPLPCNCNQRQVKQVQNFTLTLGNLLHFSEDQYLYELTTTLAHSTALTADLFASLRRVQPHGYLRLRCSISVSISPESGPAKSSLFYSWGALLAPHHHHHQPPPFGCSDDVAQQSVARLLFLLWVLSSVR